MGRTRQTHFYWNELRLLVVRSGVTRLVVLVGPYAVKIVRARSTMGIVRSWLANQSEWRHRSRVGVNPPLFTLAHVIAVYRRADEVGAWEPDDCPFEVESNEECKGSSWGRFGERWLLIDYDRAWENPRPVIGWLYYANQRRLGRKWADLSGHL